MKKLTFVIVLLIIGVGINVSVSQNPKECWLKYKNIEQAGFSKEKLAIAKFYYDSLQSSAFLIVKNGKILANWGDINRRFIIHSTRKGILNSLYGIHSENGTIDLNKSIGELGITDKDSLSELEKSAKVFHLLKVRSGVYHKAAAEPSWVEKYRPKRNSVQPDSLWFYNNWDYNVLGTIFEQETKTSIYQALYDDVAIPLQMEDYRVMDGEYYYELEYSNHPAYHMKMSARDLARYGQLYLQKGLWNGKQILSEEWVKKCTYPVSKHGGGPKIGRWYGWLWGVSEYYQDYGMFYASGVGGQFLAVFPTENLIFVNLSNTYKKHRVYDRQMLKLFDLILAARTDSMVENTELIKLNCVSRMPANDYKEKLDHINYIGDYVVGNRTVSILELEGELILKDYFMKFKLIPTSDKRFFVEDLEKYLVCEMDDQGKVIGLRYE